MTEGFENRPLFPAKTLFARPVRPYSGLIEDLGQSVIQVVNARGVFNLMGVATFDEISKGDLLAVTFNPETRKIHWVDHIIRCVEEDSLPQRAEPLFNIWPKCKIEVVHYWKRPR